MTSIYTTEAPFDDKKKKESVKIQVTRKIASRNGRRGRDKKNFLPSSRGKPLVYLVSRSRHREVHDLNIKKDKNPQNESKNESRKTLKAHNLNHGYGM